MKKLRQQTLAILTKVAEDITSATDAESVSLALFRIVDDFIDVPYSSLFLWDFEQDRLRLFANKGFNEQDRKDSEESAMERHPGWVFRTGKPLHVRDMDKEVTPDWVNSGKRSFKVRSRLWMPITTTDRSLGAFGFSSEEPDFFTQEHKSVLALVCRLAGNIYSNIVFAKAEKKYIESIELSMRMIQDASNAQQNFISKMSHEIRTPLNGIIGMAKLLEESALQGEQKKFVDIIQDQSRILLHLINDVLDISKIQSEDFRLVDFPFNLRESVQNTVQTHGITAGQKGVRMLCSIDPKVPNEVLGDALRFSQILNNLVGNAVKFTGSGQVAVEVHLLSATGDRCRIQIKVQDTGIGIEQDRVQEIFRRFVQADNSISRDHGGSGLGLFIVKELVEKMGGAIEVQSEIGKGSTFTIEIDLGKSISSTLPRTASEEFDLQGLQVLVVEDNPVNMLYLKSMLIKHGCIVQEAGDGLIALEICQKSRPDIILMDLQMPHLDGISAARRIREELKLQIPIIAQSANTVQREIDACHEAGMNDFIAKPFSFEALKKKIAHALQLTPIKLPEMEAHEKGESVDLWEHAMEMSGQDRVFAQKMIQMFSEEVPKELLNLKSAIESRNQASLSKAAHHSRSTFGILRIDNLVKLCDSMESFDPDFHAWAEMEVVYQKLRDECEQLLKQGKHTWPSQGN